MTYLQNIIGQQAVKSRLSIYHESYKTDGILPFLLFCGSKGSGKTKLIREFRKTLIREDGTRPPMLEINCATISSAGAFFNQLYDKIVDNNAFVFWDECFTGDTEILTEKGFIRFDKLEEGVKCAQVDQESLGIGFVEPTKYIKKHHEGAIVKFYSDNLCDLKMTPNHEIPYIQNGKKVKKSCIDIFPSHHTKFYSAGYSETDSEELSPIERLYIAYQADGSMGCKRVDGTFSAHFSFSKERKINRLIDLCEKANLEFKEVKPSVDNKRRFIVKNGERMSKILSNNFDITKMSTAKCRQFIEEVVEWDGSHVTDSLKLYSSTVKENADFVQSVCVLAGYKSNLTSAVDDRKESYKDCYKVFINITKNYFGGGNLKKEVEAFNGNVYCVRVPKGNIIVRRRGKTMITGNCHELPLKLQEIFLTVCEKDANPVRRITFNDTDYTFDFTQIAFAFATTDHQKIRPALDDRLTKINLTPYNKEELLDIFKCNLSEVELCNKVTPLLKDIFRGHPRHCVEIAEDLQKYANAKSISKIEEDNWRDFCKIMGIHAHGFNEAEMAIIRVLGERGEASLEAVAASTGFSKSVIRMRYEHALLSRGVLEVGQKRSLTRVGRQFYHKMLEAELG